MLEQKTTTNEEFEALCAALLPKFNEYLMRHSKNIFSCELATSLDGIKTMPALYDLDGVQKQVIAPLALLTKDVDIGIEETKKATAEAKEAAGKANEAAASVTKATTDITTERKKVEDAVSASKQQTAAAKQATEDTMASKTAIEKNETARQQAEQTRQSQETARQQAESTRNSNETTRKSQEATRVSQETARQSAETTRNANEETRKKKETTRQSQEAERVEAEKKRVAAEIGRVTAENARATAETKRQQDTNTAIANSKTQTDLAQELNEHPQKQGENGNWWKWNTTTKQYEDTGIIARGGMMYPTFEILDNELYVTDAGSNIEERIALEDNELILKL